MKKIFVLLILTVCVLFACSSGNTPKQDLKAWMNSKGRLRVLSTTAMINDLVKEVGGKHVTAISLIVGDIDPHSYELVKGDDEKIKVADLIFSNGLGLEHGASVRYHLNHLEKAIPLGDRIFEEHEERFVTVDGQIDPHIWMDMGLFSEVIDPIMSTLAEKDPKHRDYFLERGTLLKKTLKAKDLELRQKMENIHPEQRFLVTSHDAFHYFTKRYLALNENDDWEKRVNAPEGLAPDGQMSVFDIKEVSDFLCDHQIGIVFPESNVSGDSLRKIVTVCNQRGLKVEVAKTPLFGDTMAEVESYVEMMEHNVNTLILYLGPYERETSLNR